MKTLKVKAMNYSRFMNDKAKAIVDEYNSPNHGTLSTLYLEVFDNNQADDLDFILDAGRYEYKSESGELVEMLYELVDMASPVMFSAEQVEIVG